MTSTLRSEVCFSVSTKQSHDTGEWFFVFSFVRCFSLDSIFMITHFDRRCEWTLMASSDCFMTHLMMQVETCFISKRARARYELSKGLFNVFSGSMKFSLECFSVSTLTPKVMWPRSMSSVIYLRRISPSNGSSHGSSRRTCITLSLFDIFSIKTNLCNSIIWSLKSAFRKWPATFDWVKNDV